SGNALWDSADLEGGNHPTGTMTFRLYAPSDVNYTNPVYTNTIPVNGDGWYGGASVISWVPPANAATGTYQWVVTYNGDVNNPSISSGKGDEPEVVSTASSPVGTGQFATIGFWQNKNGQA